MIAISPMMTDIIFRNASNNAHLLSAYKEMKKAYLEMKRAYEEMEKAYKATGDERDEHAQRAEGYRKLAYISELTKLYNKNAYDELANLENYYHVYIDLDNLKWTNDNLGMEVGDELIKLVGNKINELKDDFLAKPFHIHGDEFIVLLESKELAKEYALKLQSELSDTTKEFKCDIVFEGVNISYGIGKDQKEAEDESKKQKEEHLKKGERAPRGEKPKNVKMHPTDSN